MNSSEELFKIAKQLEVAAALSESNGVLVPLDSLSKAANELKRSFAGSWLGYHSRVYYEGLKPAPAGANFSQEWGLQDLSFTSLGSIGYWQEYEFDEVKMYIRECPGNPDLAEAKGAGIQADKVLEASKSDIISILDIALTNSPDSFLSKLKDDIEYLKSMSKVDIAQHWAPKGQIMTRDMIAMGQGNKVPPHIDILAEVTAIRHSFEACRKAANIAQKAASHIERKGRGKTKTERIGTNVFIGHGRSSAWREFKDFIQDRMALPWDEFNRVPVAGITNIARLSEMLDAAAIAFLIMTAEDEMADGVNHARMNVVLMKKAGLFQGRLGFTKAIVLLEDGCAEFSNIQGLGQIRFPKGNIGASFEEIRRVLEREGLVTGVIGT